MHLATWEAEGGRSLKPRVGDQSRQYSKALFQKKKKKKERKEKRKRKEDLCNRGLYIPPCGEALFKVG
jgi:hypothetical protein